MSVRAVLIAIDEDDLSVVGDRQDDRIWTAFDPQESLYLASARQLYVVGKDAEPR